MRETRKIRLRDGGMEGGETMIGDNINAVREAERKADELAAEAKKKAEEILKESESRIAEMKAEGAEAAKKAAAAVLDAARKKGEELLGAADDQAAADADALKAEAGKRAGEAVDAVVETLLE